MATLRERLAEGVPLVAVSFGDDGDSGGAATVLERGIDVAELRIDWFASTDPRHVLAHVERFRGVPTLATIRSKAEGGHWPGDEPTRLRLFEAVLPAVDAVDIELSATEILPDVIAAARPAGRLVVVSHHDFTATPERAELDRIVSAARAAGADLVKISTMSNDVEDVRELTALLLRYHSQGLIVIGMGTQGSASRVFLPLLGSRITYSAIGGRPAPGQLPFEETVRLLSDFSPRFAERRRG